MSQNMTIWKYNDVELELDLGDASTAERYENAFKRLGMNEKLVKKDVSNPEFIRQYCKLYHNLFDDLFGEGTYAKLSRGKIENINVAHDIYESFLAFGNTQAKTIIDNQNRFLGKYSPNRAQRRAAAKNGKT